MFEGNVHPFTTIAYLLDTTDFDITGQIDSSPTPKYLATTYPMAEIFWKPTSGQKPQLVEGVSRFVINPGVATTLYGQNSNDKKHLKTSSAWLTKALVDEQDFTSFGIVGDLKLQAAYPNEYAAMVESTITGELIVQKSSTSSMFTKTTKTMSSFEKSTMEESVFLPASDKSIHWFTTTTLGRNSGVSFSAQDILILVTTGSISTAGSSSQTLNPTTKKVGFKILTTNFRKTSIQISTTATVFKHITGYESKADAESQQKGESMNDMMSESVLTTFRSLGESSSLSSITAQSEIKFPTSDLDVISVSLN